jgi:hypothetical protein
MDEETFNQLLASRGNNQQFISHENSSSGSSSDDSAPLSPLNKPMRFKDEKQTVLKSDHTMSRQSLQVTLLLQQSIRMGFIPSFVYKKEI